MHTWEGETDPRQARSNMMCAEWPRGSGRWLSRWVTFPKVDRCEWFDAERTAREKGNPAQVGLSDRLQGALSGDAPS